jgi:hypothetical protein
LPENVSTNIEDVMKLREQSDQRYRDTSALIDGNADRLVKVLGVSAESDLALTGLINKHAEAMDSLRRINAQQVKTIGGIQGNQKLIGSAIAELSKTQASMFDSLKRLAASVK